MILDTPTPRTDRRWHERRSGAVRTVFAARDRYAWIVSKCPPDVTELLIAATMLLNAIVLVFYPAIPPLPFPAFFGHALGMCATLGLLGLGLGLLWLRLLFAFTGIGIRVTMTLFYIQRDWHDPVWAGYLIGATALSWVLVRVLCEAKTTGDLDQWLELAKLPHARGFNE